MVGLKLHTTKVAQQQGDGDRSTHSEQRDSSYYPFDELGCVPRNPGYSALLNVPKKNPIELIVPFISRYNSSATAGLQSRLDFDSSPRMVCGRRDL